MLALACTLALIGALAGALSSPLTATADEGLVTITLDSVTPDTLSPGGTVTISGHVTNTSARPMTHVQVSFWRSTDPVTSDADFDLLLGSPWDVPIGARGTADANLFNITTDQAPTFAPAATSPFTVTATVAQLGFTNPAPGTVYLTGVHVRGIPIGDINQTVGRARVFLPWQPTTAAARVAPVVLLTSAPALALDGTLTDDHLAGELTGRLATLLRAAEVPGATVLIDPSLIDELTTMSDGYQTGGLTIPADDPRAIAARDWLTRFRALAGTVYRTPYGNPDLAAAAADNRTEVVQRVQKALPPDHELASLPLAIWPERTALNPAARQFLAPLKPTLWVEHSATDGTFSLPDASSVVTYDGSITTGGPGPDPRATLPQRRGRLLSQLVLTPRPTVLGVRTAADAATLLSLPSWVSTVALTEVPTTVGAPPSASAVPTALEQVWAAIDQNHRRVSAWYDLTGAADQGALSAAQIASRAANPILGTTAGNWLDKATASIPQNLAAAGVSLQMARTFVLGDSTGTLPITITNASNQAVRVKVRMTSDNAQRITIPDTPVVTVPAHSSVSVQFMPQAKSNGVVEFTAQALTQGNLSVGAPRRFSVNATNFGQVGWLIIIASGVVVLGGTAMRIKQVQRERAKHLQPTAHTTAQPAVHPERATTSATPRHDTSSRPHP